VIKFVVQDSIEDQIVQLQAKKLAMTDAALSRDPDAALGKLTVEDVSALALVVVTDPHSSASSSSSKCFVFVLGHCRVPCR